MHPRHDPGRGQVRSVGHVHAAGRSRDHRARSGGLDEAAHRRGGFAALARTVTGSVKLLLRDVVNAFDLFVIYGWYGRHNLPSYFTLLGRSRLRIHPRNPSWPPVE